MTDLWRPIGSRAALRTLVAREIERLVEGRQLKPGDRLPPERELARILQVGRSSLREATATLVARGLLTVKRGHGVYVAERPPTVDGTRLTADDLRQLFDMREIIEVAAAGWAAAAAGDEDVAALRATVRALDAEATAGQPDVERLQELDTDFHLLIAAMARNRFLEQMTHLLHQWLAAGMEATLQVPGRVQRSRRSHLRVARAIARHDVEAARAAMLEHVREVREAALRPGP
jgi:GntR family transcriptional regulator, transcriptional repressor for pyruvate dehydrogenase complex